MHYLQRRMLLAAILIAFYVVVAVGVAATTSAGTQHVSAGTSWKCIPHPSWAWWLVSICLLGYGTGIRLPCDPPHC